MGCDLDRNRPNDGHEPHTWRTLNRPRLSNARSRVNSTSETLPKGKLLH